MHHLSWFWSIDFLIRSLQFPQEGGLDLCKWIFQQLQKLRSSASFTCMIYLIYLISRRCTLEICGVCLELTPGATQPKSTFKRKHFNKGERHSQQSMLFSEALSFGQFQRNICFFSHPSRTIHASSKMMQSSHNCHRWLRRISDFFRAYKHREKSTKQRK